MKKKVKKKNLKKVILFLSLIYRIESQKEEKEEEEDSFVHINYGTEAAKFHENAGANVTAKQIAYMNHRFELMKKFLQPNVMTR